MDGGAWWAAVHGVAKSQTQLSDFTFFLSIVPFGEGNVNPLQCSCLENPMDREAWWAAIYGVAQSRTQLKRLSSRMLRTIPEGPWLDPSSNSTTQPILSLCCQYSGLLFPSL